MKSHVLLAVLFFTTTLAINQAFAEEPKNSQDSLSCNNGLIRGTYAFTLQGQKLGGAPGTPIGPQFGVAMTTFDGKTGPTNEGGLVQVDSATVNGIVVSDFTHPPATGTYSVNQNCTGTFELNFTDGRPPVTVNFVVATNGLEIDTVVTSAGGNQGILALQSIGKRRFPFLPVR